MKDNYSEMNVDMEQILFSKEYDELTASELEEIKDFISSKEDFYLMKNTLMSVKSSFGVEEEIEPRTSSKDDLMKMFEQKHGKVVPMNKPRPFYLNPVFQIGIAALFILGIIFFYPKGENEKTTAMNETKVEEDAAKKSPAKEKEEMPAEELTEAETVAEETVAKDAEADHAPAMVANEFSSVTSRDDKPGVMKNKMDTDGLAKGEGAFKTGEISHSADSVLISDVYRSSSKKSKDKVAVNDDELAESTITSGDAVTLTSGSTTSSDWNFASTKEEEKKESDKKKDGKFAHTNTAGGLYHQPAKPAADLKQGVSLQDKPALTEFLFTAL